MKKILSKILVAVISVTLIISVFIFDVSAASATIAFNKSTFSVNENVTVTITVKSDNMVGSDITINYDSSYLSYVSGADEGGAGEVRIVDTSMNDVSKKSYKIVFKTLKTGSSAISVSGTVTDGYDEPTVAASANLKVQEASKSSNANLKSLSLQHGTLTPSFSANVTSYTAKVENDITSCTIFASTADSKATTEFTGSSSLKVGENIRKVIVTAQSGATKTYTITITRLDEDEKLTENEKEEETTNPLETLIDDVTYVISTDISSVKLLNGFTEEKIDFKGMEVPVATDEENNYILYYLSTTTSDTLQPYTYNESDDTFTPISFLRQSENDYIFSEIPEDYLSYFENNYFYVAELNINNFTIKAYNSPVGDLADFYYMYAFSNGGYSMYRYDARENVLQRCPDFNMHSTVSAPVTETEKSNDSSGFLAKFNTLSSNAKIVLIALVGALLCTIVLIILLIVKFCTKIKYRDELEEDFRLIPYKNISINDNFASENQISEENNKTE